MNFYDNQGAAVVGMQQQPQQQQWNLPPGGHEGLHHHEMAQLAAMQGQQPPQFMIPSPMGVNTFIPTQQMMNEGGPVMQDWHSQPMANVSAERMLFNQPNSGINFDNYENIPVDVSGGDVPEPIDRFTDAALHEWIQANISRAGYTKPTPVQKNSIPTLLAGRDLMSCAQTGSGKTAAFLLPIINAILYDGPSAVMPPTYNAQGRKCLYPSALILSPTRELAMQIHKEADKFSYRTNIQTAILYGGRENYRDQINRLRNGCNILIATPGRLIDIIEQGYVSLEGIRYLVLDEADRMLDMGFEPQIRKVVSLKMPDKSKRTTAMFSATFPKEIQVLAQDFLKENYVFLAVGRVGSTSENIEQHVEWIEEHDKKKALCNILECSDPTTLILVFVETKRGANELAWFLQRGSVRAVAIHGDLKQFERERNLEMFRTNKCNVLVATAVAARGLDIPNVRHVVNFDLPNDVDEYVHRIGRTGRCGNTGISTSFFNDKNRGLSRDLQNLLSEANQEVPEFLRRCASEGGTGRGSRGRFGGVDHRRGRGGGVSFNGGRGGGAHAANFGAPSGGFGARPVYPGFNPSSGHGMRGGYQASFAGFTNGAPPSFGGGFQPQTAPQQSFRGFAHQGQTGGFSNGRGGGNNYNNGASHQSQHHQQQYSSFPQQNGYHQPPPQQQSQQHFGMWGQQ